MYRTVTTIAIASLAVAALALAGAAQADTASVSVTATLAPRTELAQSDGAVLIRSNVPWELVLESEDDIEVLAGGKTRGTALTLPETVERVWLAPAAR